MLFEVGGGLLRIPDEIHGRQYRPHGSYGWSRIRLNEPPEFRAIRAAVERIEGATRYLQDIRDALERGTPIPKPFHDHALSGALRHHRSVIVGDLEYGQVTFPLVYRRRGAVTDLIVVEQHSDVYRLARLK